MGVGRCGMCVRVCVCVRERPTQTRREGKPAPRDLGVDDRKQSSDGASLQDWGKPGPLRGGGKKKQLTEGSCQSKQNQRQEVGEGRGEERGSIKTVTTTKHLQNKTP